MRMLAREKMGGRRGSTGWAGGGGEIVRVLKEPLKAAVLVVRCRSGLPAGGEFA